MKRFLGPLCFIAFCFLITFRDILTDLLQLTGANFLQWPTGIHPSFLLLVWSIEAALLAWILRIIRNRSFGFIKPFLQFSREQQWDFIKLGIATGIVYAVTVYGIRSLTAPVFNMIDYGIMPMLTLLTAYWINKEEIRSKQMVGAVFSFLGIALLLYSAFNPSLPSDNNRLIWVLLAILSPLFTSVSSSLQRKQVMNGMTPDEVLLYRFPIPAIIMVLWFLIVKFFFATPEFPVKAPIEALPVLLLIGAVTFFLPLWLLCYAFVRSSVGQLAAYLFMIPVFTFIFGPLLVKREWGRILTPEVWIASALLFCGYLVAEGFIRSRRSVQLDPEEN